MKYLVSLLVFSTALLLRAQETSNLPFQVLVAEGATIYGEVVKPLQFVDDVTSIEIANGGFISLVHQGGSTFEKTEKIFTFYLKPHELKKREQRPKLEQLYMDSVIRDYTKIVTVLSPPFDTSGYMEWNEDEPLEIYWHLHDEPVLNYIISVSDGQGKKIQDFRTSLNKYILKPNTYGLQDGLFSFQITSTFAGEKVSSKTYSVQLKKAPPYEVKAADLVLKALDLELNPVLALPVWQQAIAMPYGEFYKPLFTRFLVRNADLLSATGTDVQQLLSQSK